MQLHLVVTVVTIVVVVVVIVAATTGFQRSSDHVAQIFSVPSSVFFRCHCCISLASSGICVLEERCWAGC